MNEGHRSQNRALLQRMLIYLIGNVATKLITLVLTRLQTGFIEPRDYGQYALLSSLLPQLVSIAFFECWSGVLRFMYDEREEEKVSIFGDALFMCLFLAPFFFILLFAVLSFNQSLELFGLMVLMGACTLFDYLYQFSSRGLGYSRLFAITGMLSSLVLGLSQIFCLTVLKMGGKSMIWSPIFAAVTSVAIYEWQTGIFRKNFKIWQKRRREDKKLDREASLLRQRALISKRFALARFCFPLAINAGAFFALSKFNELYISRYGDPVGLSQLSAANRMGMFINLFITVFSLAWQETAFSVASDEGRATYYTRTFDHYIRILGAGMLCLLPSARIIASLLLDPRHYGEETRKLIPLTLLAIVLSALSTFLGHLFSAEKRTGQLFYSTILGTTVNVLVMLGLYPVIGLQACNLALAAGFLATLIYRFCLIQSSVRIAIQARLVAVLALTLTLSSWIYFRHPDWMWTSVNIVLCVMLAIFLLRNDLQQILSRARRQH